MGGVSAPSILPTILDDDINSLGRPDQEVQYYGTKRQQLQAEKKHMSVLITKRIRSFGLLLGRNIYAGSSTKRSVTSTSHQYVMKRSPATNMGPQLLGRRRPFSRVEKRVRTLRGLVPRSRSTSTTTAKSMDLNGLFQETGDYIVGLEMQVKVMQILVKVLSD